MTVREIEARFGGWVLAARWPIIAGILSLVAFVASGARFLEFSPDYRLYFDGDDPQLVAFETLEGTYSESNNVLFVIAPSDGDAMSAHALEAAAWLTERAWETPFSTRVDSIVNFQHMTTDGDDIVVSDLVSGAVRHDPAERARVRAIALAEPGLAGRLIARDGRVSAVNVTVHLPGDDENLEAGTIVDFARGVASEVRQRFPGIDVRITGLVPVNHGFSEVAQLDMATLIPASLGVMALMLLLLTRGLGATFGTILVVILSVVAAVGFLGWLRIPFTPPLLSSPFVVLTVAVANCVHIVMTLLHGMRAGSTKRDAIVESLRVNLEPVCIASLTTALGFLSLNFSESPPFRYFGTFAAFGVGAAFVLSVTFLPALLSLLPLRVRTEGNGRDVAMERFADFVVRRRKGLMWGSVLVVVALAASAPRNELNDVFLHYLDEKVEARRDADFTIENLTGLHTIEYSLSSGETGGVSEPAFLSRVAAFAEWCKEQSETLHVNVVTDMFRQLNKTMHGDDPAEYRLPASRDLAAQYLLLYEMSLPQGLDLNDRIDVDKSATRVTVTTKVLSSQEILAFNRRAEQWLADHAPNIAPTRGTGPDLMFAYLGQRNARAMFVGTTLALAGISFLLVFALRSLRLGLVSLIPNLVPAATGFGIWGLVDGQIGLSLSIVTSITLGIVVDDTVHFLSKYRRARSGFGYASADAVRYTFLTVGRAMLVTSLVLVAGFSVLGLSNFEINSGMGQLTALIVALALLADFFLLPALLMKIEGGSEGAVSESAARARVHP